MLSGAPISYADFIGNIVPVTLGNTLGGVIVATVYYLVFLNSNHFARDSAVASPKPCSTSIGLLENLSTFVPLSRLAIWSGLYSEALRLGKHLRQRAALGALWRKNSRPGSTSRRQAS